jgi:MFS family permease
MAYRFLTGLGVGGEFAVGVALLAEVMPDRARPFAIGWLQSLSAIGNITAAVIALVGTDWRTMFLIGTGPALLAILIRRRLKEPERWQEAVAVKREKLGSYSELFGDPRWRRNAFVGLALAFAGVVGLWGIAFFSYDMIRDVFRPYYVAQELSESEINRNLGFWAGMASILQNAGGFLGIHFYSVVSQRTGRRFAFLVSFLLAMTSTAFTFWFLGRFFGTYDVFWMIPLMGFCQLALFGGYAIYFPELFPTRLRSTGTSFCYNVGRFVAAVGPFTIGYLKSQVYAGFGSDAFRYAAVTMCVCFFIGLAALPFAPETKGKPLPE